MIVTSAVARIGLDELAVELLRRVPPRDETVELEALPGTPRR